MTRKAKIITSTYIHDSELKRELKIFHGLVNYGTQAGSFTQALREIGYEAYSLVEHDPFNRISDDHLKDTRSSFQKIINVPINFVKKLKCFFYYNTFHFYFGKSLLPMNLDLPFYKFFGKRVIMEYLGIEVQKYQTSIAKYGKYTNVAVYNIKNGVKHDAKITRKLNFLNKYVDIQFVCAPYLSEFVPGSKVLPLAINLDVYQYKPLKIEKKIKILHAPTHRGNKGTEFIISAINTLIKEGYDIDFALAENISHKALLQKYLESHIFIDQIMAGWYGTASIEAMAIGRPVICFIRESYFEHINFGDKIPIINANEDNIYEVLKYHIENNEKLPQIGLKSRLFVEEVHDVKKITQQLTQIYTSIYEKESRIIY